MWELYCEESWVPKNWCFWTAVLEKTLENHLDCKEINQSILKESSPGCSLEGLMLKLILWPPDANWLIGKDPDAGKDWRWEEKGTTEDEIVGWNHWLDGHEFEQAPGAGDGQEAWRTAVHGVTKSWTQLSNWTELIALYSCFSIWILVSLF